MVISVNAQADPEPTEKDKEMFIQTSGRPFDISAYKLSKLEECIPERVPMGTDGRGLRKNGVASVFYKVIVSEIEAVLSRRNTLTPEPDRMRWAQFAHFTYSDGAFMMTVGVVLHTEAETPMFDSCALNQLDYFRGGALPYQIQVPALTSREISHLNSQLPSPKGRKLVCEGVTDRDIGIYSEIYRFFPNYSEVLWT